eukprot:g8903.t1
MPNAEWRLFFPTVDSRRAPAEARTMIGMLDHVPPAARTDVYLKAGADVGVKRRGGGGLEFKALRRRQTLGGGVGPGTAETFEKVRLGDDATPAHVLDHLREKSAYDGGTAGVSEELEALMIEPVEVSVAKAVRKMDISPGGHMVSFEVTEVSVSSSKAAEASPRDWITFCVEGSVESIEAFLSEAGKPLVALLSLPDALQVGYPQFVQMIPTQ